MSARSLEAYWPGAVLGGTVGVMAHSLIEALSIGFIAILVLEIGQAILDRSAP